ncbi:DUF2336 domain-containing protein [Maritalea sp.]|jgi:hypothetical protein|uniref:DUF2336 domain-containing protein n=1 Tax=Maritalea sp. TaxID=2003361 RepID=UPI0039E30422
MIGFQPYETFQLLIETGGIDRANTLLVAACDAYSRRPKPMPTERMQFEALAQRLFPTAAPSARALAAAKLARSPYLSPILEKLVIEHIGDELASFLENNDSVSEELLLNIVEGGDIDKVALVAKRKNLTRKLVSKIFPVNSRKVYRSLSQNRSIHFSGPYLRAISKAAAMDQVVAHSLADREDFDKAYLLPAFFDLKEDDRLEVLKSFQGRRIPRTKMHRTYEHISVATAEFTQAMMKLLSKNRRPEVTRLLTQITGLDEVRCGDIAHDVSGAALFVVLRAFGCNEYDGLKVLIHATAHDRNSSGALAQYTRLFKLIEPEAMVFAMSVWRGDAEITALAKEASSEPISHQTVAPYSRRTPELEKAADSATDAVERAMRAVQNLRANRTS